jgi:hypothetical protein
MHRPLFMTTATASTSTSTSTYTIPPSGPVSTATTIMLSPEEKQKVGRGKTAIIAGATGYIGKAVVQECVARGYHTIALVRDRSKLFDSDGTTIDSSYAPYLKGAQLVDCNVEDTNELQATLEQYSNVDVMACCLASASGIKEFAERVDYQSSLNFLKVGHEIGARHYVLLSAFCVRRPLLELQRQKLRVRRLPVIYSNACRDACFSMRPVVFSSPHLVSFAIYLVFIHMVWYMMSYLDTYFCSLKRSLQHRMI